MGFYIKLSISGDLIHSFLVLKKEVVPLKPTTPFVI